MGISAGLTAFRLSFELSPVILTGGIAANLPGEALPIISITQSLDFVAGLLSGGNDLTDLDDFFAHFVPIAGSTLIDQQFGKYPFANQAVAANSVIRQPNTISLRMICPARGAGGYALKLATILALQSTLAAHNASGGTYTVATPSYFYTNCLLRQMRDITGDATAQAQETYQFDFEQPLLTLQDAQAAQNSLMSQISAGTPIGGTPAWSGLAPTVGNVASLGSIGTIPAAAGPAGTGTAAPLVGVGPGPQQ